MSYKPKKSKSSGLSKQEKLLVHLIKEEALTPEDWTKITPEQKRHINFRIQGMSYESIAKMLINKDVPQTDANLKALGQSIYLSIRHGIETLVVQVASRCRLIHKTYLNS